MLVSSADTATPLKMQHDNMSTQLNTYRLFTQLTVVVMAIAFCATGCKKNQKTTLSPIDYSATAEQLFEKASFAFERERWADAEKMFSEVRRQYPYSRFASTAEIRSADCLFSQGSLAEAAVAYQHFLKTYPTHPEAPFAAFRRSVAYFKQIPGDFFIMPPSHERDRSATRDARAAIADRKSVV